MVKLKQITWTNFWEVVKLAPKENQAKYVKPVSVFMAQSYINLKEGYKDESLAVYNDDILIGFTKIVFVPKDVKPYYLNDDAYMIDSLIIDKAHQGEGYGKEALSVIINYCASHPFKPAEHIALVCYEENKGAQALFKSFNFQKVKQTNKTEKMILYNRHMIRNH